MRGTIMVGILLFSVHILCIHKYNFIGMPILYWGGLYENTIHWLYYVMHISIHNPQTESSHTNNRGVLVLPLFPLAGPHCSDYLTVERFSWFSRNYMRKFIIYCAGGRKGWNSLLEPGCSKEEKWDSIYLD